MVVRHREGSRARLLMLSSMERSAVDEMKTGRMLVIVALLAVTTSVASLASALSPVHAVAVRPRTSAFAPAGAPAAHLAAPADDGAWFSLGTGIGGTVNALAVAENSGGGDLVYVGGAFSDAGGNAAADYIALWDGTAWQSLPAGLNDTVEAIELVPPGLYAGGAFTGEGGVADHVAYWDGSDWHPLGSGLNDLVYSLATMGADLYAGGRFTNAGGDPHAKFIARWDGSAWHPLGDGLNGYVLSLAALGTDLYACGYFTDAGGDPNADRVARWDGSAWHPLDTGLNGVCQSLAVSGTDLYVGGSFAWAGGDSHANCIARWDGLAWHAVGENAPLCTVTSIAFAGANIYVAASDPYRLDGSFWQLLDPAFYGHATEIGVGQKGVYLGGDFADLGGNSNADGIALWKAVALWPPTAVYSRYDVEDDIRQVRWVNLATGQDEHLADGSFPRLSPDGNYVVFLRGGGYPPDYQNDLYVHNLANGAETLVFSNNDYIVGYDWTNDNQQIVFDFGCAIYRMNRDGTGTTQVVKGDCYHDAPAVSPQDGYIAFHNQYVGIVVAADTGEGAVQVPNTQPGDFWPAWSPDGEWLSFIRGEPDQVLGGGDYYKVRLDGTELTRLTFLGNDADNHMGPAGAWSEDGAYIVAPGTLGGETAIYAIPTSSAGRLLPIASGYGAQTDFVGSMIGDVVRRSFLPVIVR
jgi:Tol biopolymer transport system component